MYWVRSPSPDAWPSSARWWSSPCMTTKLELLVDTHLGCQEAGGLSNTLPMSILVQTFTSIATLIKSATESRELTQGSFFAWKCRGRLVHVGVATLKNLGLIDFSHTHQVHCMVPFSDSCKYSCCSEVLALMFCIGLQGPQDGASLGTQALILETWPSLV